MFKKHQRKSCKRGENQMKKVILDCDPGHDDAFAIMLAAKHLDVLGITTVGGNGTLENVTKNALKVLEVINRGDIPVYPGHAGPLVQPLTTAPQFHGESGMDGPDLPEPKIKPQNKHAVDFIVDTVLNHKDITLIATGPLTNIAGAINKNPEIISNIKEICIMGGSVTFGNWTPAAEFNIFVDPEAASKVFNSGARVKMTGVNLTRQCLITEKEVAQFRAIGTKASIFAAELVEYFAGTSLKSASLRGANLHDACAVAWEIDPNLIVSTPMHIDVELHGKLTRGMTVCDYRHLRGEEPQIDLYREPTMDYRGKAPNAEAALELDFDGFLSLLYETLEAYSEKVVEAVR
jgi:pyrimidine-specific ribonucleoside hydrolase